MTLPSFIALMILLASSGTVCACHPEIRGSRTQGDKETGLNGDGATGLSGEIDSSLIRFSPEVLVVTRDSTGYVQSMIEFYSLAGDSLRLEGIEATCKCGTASVQRPFAKDSIAGKFFVQINAKHFVDPVNYVDYTLHIGPAGHTEHFRVVVYLKP